MDFAGRPMKGMVYVEPPAIASEAELASWLEPCLQFALSLKAK
jgi:hypothetical protein